MKTVISRDINVSGVFFSFANIRTNSAGGYDLIADDDALIYGTLPAYTPDNLIAPMAAAVIRAWNAGFDSASGDMAAEHIDDDGYGIIYSRNEP